MSRPLMDYLDQLVTDKEQLVENLNIKLASKHITSTTDETFTDLIPKVLLIDSIIDIPIVNIIYDSTTANSASDVYNSYGNNMLIKINEDPTDLMTLNEMKTYTDSLYINHWSANDEKWIKKRDNGSYYGLDLYYPQHNEIWDFSDKTCTISFKQPFEIKKGKLYFVNIFYLAFYIDAFDINVHLIKKRGTTDEEIYNNLKTRILNKQYDFSSSYNYRSDYSDIENIWLFGNMSENDIGDYHVVITDIPFEQKDEFLFSKLWYISM
jgi:hypothetical protein